MHLNQCAIITLLSHFLRMNNSFTDFPYIQFLRLSNLGLAIVSIWIWNVTLKYLRLFLTVTFYAHVSSDFILTVKLKTNRKTLSIANQVEYIFGSYLSLNSILVKWCNNHANHFYSTVKKIDFLSNKILSTRNTTNYSTKRYLQFPIVFFDVNRYKRVCLL